MKICKDHWTACREAVESRGLSSLVAADGKEAVSRVMDEFNGGDMKKNFDPLMSMNFHFTNNALSCGGLYLMGTPPDGENDGHYCPICEFVKNARDWDAKVEIAKVADQMREWALAEGLVPKVS